MIRKIIIVSILIIAVILSGCIDQKIEKKTTEEGKGSYWCKVGMKLPANVGNAGIFTIKGITEYNGTEVCEAVIESESGSIVQYFNQKNDYAVILYKGKDGKVVEEINLNNENSSRNKSK